MERSKLIILAWVTLNSVKFAIADNSKVSIITENEIELIGPSEIDYNRMFNGKLKLQCNSTLVFTM